MPVEEGLVIPTFGLDPAADELVLPTPPPPTPAPQKPAATPTRFDPAGKGPRQGMGFLENFLGSFGSGTIEGSLNEAEAIRLARGGVPLPEVTATDQGSGFVPEMDETQARALREEARGAVFDQVAYDLAPTRITPSSIAGSLGGMIAAPTNLFGFGGEAIAKGLASRGFGEAAQMAGRFGAQASGTAAAVQDIRHASGAREDSSLPEQLLSGVAGAVLGAGTHAAGQALGKAAGGVAEFVRNRRAQRDALGIDLPREALSGAADPVRGQSEAVAGSLDRTAPAEAALRTEEPARGMPAAESDPAAPVSREQADGWAEPIPPQTEGDLPPVPDGHVRMFHGGEDPTAGGSRWATPDRQYARDYGKGGRAVHYVDVPVDHPALARMVEPEDVAGGIPQRYGNSNLPQDIAAGFRQAAPAAVEDTAAARALREGSPSAEPPPFKAATRAEWDNIRPATAPDAPAWAPKIQSTLDELARGFDMEPPRVSVAKPKFDDTPLFGTNDRQGNILLAEGMSEHHALNNAVHEFGHEVQFRLYDAAPMETRDAIQAAFREATARDAGTTSLNQLRPITATRKLGDAGQPKRIKTPRTGDDPIPAGSSAAGYQHSFEEWFAEQVSRWVTQDAKPVGVVERFFSGVAEAWRKIYAKVTGHTPLDAEVKAFLEGRWQGSEAGRVRREPVPVQAIAGSLIGAPVPDMAPHRVTVAGREPIQVAPVVVEARDLKTSADAGFDATLQPRQRDRAASQEQIRDIATNLEPERLGVSAEADRGAPIVGNDSMVESGNGRVLAIRRAYEQDGAAAARYRDWLGRQGVDVSGFDEPVLVRQRLTKLSPDERRGFTDAANRTATLAMSAPERAMADARLVTPDSLDLIRNANDLGAAANRDFVRSFTARLPQTERGAMTTAEGGLSSEGLARVRNAVLAKAYDHPGVLSRIAEATNDEVKSISNALVAAAPDWAKLRADIARGAVREDVDLTAELLEAVTRTADLRAKGQKLDTFLQQQDAFDRLPRPVEAFMRMFTDEKGRRAAGAPVVAERLRAYAGEARKVLADQGLDLGMPRVSAEDIQAAAARRGQRTPEGEGALLFSRRQPADPRQISFFDRVAEGLRSAKPTADGEPTSEAAGFLHALGTEMADRAGREGADTGGTALGRLAVEDGPFSVQLRQEMAAAAGDAAAVSGARAGAVADLERTLAARGIEPPPAPGLLTSPETSLVEAATRLHGAPAERAIPLEELRAAVPGQSAADVNLAVAALRERGVAKVTDRGVVLDHAGVQQVHEATERYVRDEAADIGQALFRRRAPKQGIEEPDQIRQGRPVEDQGTAPVEGDTRPERLESLGARVAADFETILRTGRVQPGARGQFNTSTGVARVRSLADLDTTMHEVGHSLQQSPQTRAAVDPVIARNRGELAPLGAGTGATGDAEAFAELFRLYATNRAYAERTYPNATADLERTMREALPAQADALDRLRADLDVIHRADSGAVVGSDVITPKPDGLFTRILDTFGADFIGAAAADPRGGVYYAWRDALYTRLLSPHHPINRAMSAFGRVYRENTGKTLDLLPQDHAYILARVGSGANVVAQSMLEHGVRGARSDTAAGASFRDAIEAAIGKRYTKDQWHDFGAYLTARSMVADYERFAAGEIPNPPGKLSAADYARAVQEFEAKYSTFADGAEKFYGFNTKLLQRHYDKGLFTKEYYDAAMARKDYAPKLRDMEDLGTSALTGGGARRDGASMMKTFRGSQRSVLNPLDSTVKKVYDLEQAAALNDTKAALARLAEIAGPGSGFIAEPIPANKLSSVRVDVVDALRAAGSRANVDGLDLGALIHQAEGMLGDDVFTHIFRQEPIRPGAEPITFYYINGERRALRLADDAFGRELHVALNAMTQPERNILLSVLQISTTVLRQGVTKSLGFIYRNFTRDQGTSVGTGARGYIPFISALQGGFDAVRGGGDFEKYLSFGGFAGGIIHEVVEGSALARGGAQRMFREKNVVSRILGVGAKGAELSEAATRAGQFKSYLKQARELGFDDYNAALYATFKTNDYIDFRKIGSHMAVVSRGVPFLNATAQGTDKEARALIGDMVRLEGKRLRGEELSRIEIDNLNDSRAAWVKTLTWGMIFGGGVAYLNSDDPEWFGAAQWRRDRGHNLLPIGPDGNWLSFPKAFGLVRNVSDLFEYGVEYLMRGDLTIAGKLGHALAEAHTAPYTNPFIDTFYGVRSNYDAFRGRPIVPPSLQALPASEQYTRYTSEIAKGIGQATGWSPMKVDYAAKNLGGGTAIDFLRNADSLIHWMQDKPGGKAKTIWDLPLARELVQNLSVGAEATTRFYSLVGQKAGTLEQAATAYGQKIASGDRTGAETYLRGLPANERAYATLQKQGFDSSDKLLHPLVLARAYNAVIAGVSRAIGDRNLIPEGDLDRSNLTLSRRDAKPIEVDGPTGEKLRNALDAYAMVTARNALIAYGADGMQGVPVKDPGEFLDRIKILSPDVARELRGRLAAKRLYDPAVVAERWPEAKARLLKDGENADLSDLLPRRPKSGTRERKRAMSDE